MKIRKKIHELYLLENTSPVGRACVTFGSIWQPGEKLQRCFISDIEVEHNETYHEISFAVTLIKKLDLELALEFANILCRVPDGWGWDVVGQKAVFIIPDWRI